MSISEKYKINESKVVHDTIDGEVILIHMDSGNYYSIDFIGADIWNLISKNMSTSQIIDIFIIKYEGAVDQINKSVRTFITKLLDEDLIVLDISDDSPSSKLNQIHYKHKNHEKNIYSPPRLEIYSDMQDLLLLDPIHEVDKNGWPNESKS